jgi:hypothetical protein
MNIHAPGGIQLTISAGERPQTYALDCSVTGIGYEYGSKINFEMDDRVSATQL